MLKIPIYEEDTPSDISLRAGMPVCMLLRMNGVLSAAWLKTQKSASIIEGFSCGKSSFPCPRDFVKARIHEKTGCIPCKDDTAKSIAQKYRVPERLVKSLLQKNGTGDGRAILIPKAGKDMKIHLVSVFETWKSFQDYESLMLLNDYFGPLYPGMKILVRGQNKP